MDKLLVLNKIQEYYNFKKDVDFANHLGIPAQNLSKWKTRGTFDAELIYTKCTEINPEWLLTGEGSMLKEKAIDTVKESSEDYHIFQKKDKKEDYIDQLLKAKDEVIENQKLTIDAVKIVLEMLYEKSNPDKLHYDAEIQETYLAKYINDAKELIQKK